MRNGQEIVNEFAILLAAYHLLFFTPWIYEPDVRDYMGFQLVGVIGVTVLINIFLFLYIMVKNLILRCRIRKAKNQAKKNAVKCKEDAQTAKEAKQIEADAKDKAYLAE